MHKVLKWATEEVDNPDLRDRGFMYWRMLAINPAVAGEIVLAEKPAITTDSDRMDRGALDQLLLHTGTLGSIYHKNPEVCNLLTFGHSHPYITLDLHPRRSWQGFDRQPRTQHALTTSPRPRRATHPPDLHPRRRARPDRAQQERRHKPRREARGVDARRRRGGKLR